MRWSVASPVANGGIPKRDSRIVTAGLVCGPARRIRASDAEPDQPGVKRRLVEAGGGIPALAGRREEDE